MKKETVDDFDPMLLEYPFVRKGMTVEEYDEERAYYLSQGIEDLKNCSYMPLWKQKKDSIKSNENY